MTTVNEVDRKIDSHIDICAVRYESIEKEMRAVNARLKRLETVMMSATAFIIALLIHLITK